MAGESKIRQIYEFRAISGVNKDPGAAQHGKFIQWDNNLKTFVYTDVTGDNLVLNSKTTNGIVAKGNDATAGGYVWKLDVNKNPGWNKEEYLSTVAKASTGNNAVFTMNSGATKTLPLGSLAWQDYVVADLNLPGDTKILYDGEDLLRGSANFTYNYTNNRLQFINTGLFFKTGTESYQEGVKYLGNYSWSFGNSSTSNSGGSYNITSGYRAGQPLSTNSTKNTISGAFAGESINTDAEGHILIGAYAGRYETGNNKFFLDNKDHSNTADARTNSFLYADLDTERRLYIRDRLAVVKEGKFGDSGIADGDGEAGMFQMAPVSAGVVKPQWYSDGKWNDFDSSVDKYLDDVEYASGEFTFIMSDTTEFGPFSIISDTPYASSTGTPNVTSDYGLLQLSNSSLTTNRGFTHKAGLSWNESSSEFNIPGAIKLTNKAQYTASDGVLIQDGTHAYVRLGSAWKQLDNEPTAGEANTVSNIGTAGVGVYKQKTDLNFELKKLNTSDARLTVTDDTGNNEIDFGLNLTLTGNNLTPSTTLTYSGSIFKEVTTPTGTTPTFVFKKLISDTVAITDSAGELRLEVTGAGGGEANTGESLGAGIAIYKETVAPVLKFKSITAAGAHNTVSANVDGSHIDITVDDNSTSFLGTGQQLFVVNADNWTFDQKGIKAVANSGITVTSDDDDIIINQTVAIPFIGTSTNNFSAAEQPSLTDGAEGTINFRINFSSDIRTVAASPVNFLSLKIGDGLRYSASTNTLYAVTSSGGSTEDLALREVTTNHNASNYVYNLNVRDALGGNSTIYPITVPKYVLAAATYAPSVEEIESLGGIAVNNTVKAWTLGNTQQLILDSGLLSIDADLITYDAQNELHDVDNLSGINLKRTTARANIGAAYINGDIAEEFNASDLNVGESLTANSLVDTHTIGGFTVEDNVLTGSEGSTWKGTSTTGTKIVQSANNIDITVDDYQVGGAIRIKNSTGSTMFLFNIATGNLYVKGKIFADQDIEAFTPDTTI